MERIKVLLLNTRDSGGGAARATYRLHRSLAEIGIESKMVVKEKNINDDSIIEIRSLGSSENILKRAFLFFYYKLKRYKRRIKWNSYAVTPMTVMSDTGILFFKELFLKKFDFDILHLNWVAGNFIDIRDLRKINKPVVWTMHDCAPFTGGCHLPGDCKKFSECCGACPKLNSSDPSDITSHILKEKSKIYQNIRMNIVAPSKWMMQQAKDSILFREQDITYIPNGIDIKIFRNRDKDDSKRFFHLDEKTKFILFGGIHPVSDANKGFQHLQKAMKIISDSKKENLGLLIFGTESADSICNLPARYLGNLDDDSMVNAYNAAEVTVVPSESENLSYIIMESLSCGTPVVAFDIGGNSDMIEHKKNGYLARPFDTNDLAEGIAWCISNNAEKQISENASKKIAESFSSGVIADKYKSMYQKTLLPKELS